MNATEARKIRIGWATTAQKVHQAQQVRHRVFCEEQGVSLEAELDGLDGEAMHLLALTGEGEHAVGTLRLLLLDGVARLGRVAVLPRWRRQGIASRMMRLAVRRAARCGCREVRLASQLEVIGLYERFGFTVQSEPFEEAGIAHVWMARTLVSPHSERGIDPTHVAPRRRAAAYGLPMASAPQRDSAQQPDGAGVVISVGSSPVHTFSKPPQPSIRLLAGLGVEGDAHMGEQVKHRSRVARDPTQPNLRQVHLIHAELHDELNACGFSVGAGDMGENVTTRGVDLLALPTGTRLALGDEAVVEITGLRNPCSQLDGFQDGLMAAVLDRDEHGALVRKSGVMAVVHVSGEVHPGDPITVQLPPEPHRPLEKV